ncbi:MAG: M24 family metallopeptidase [Bacteroidota bacterium]|nr:M24 family metallopeptidase [Bacteroidota bacterium]
MDILREKIAQAVSILREKKIDVWLTFVRESATMPDPALAMIAGHHTTWETAWIITRSGDTIAIAGSLDVEAIKSKSHYREVIPYVQGIRPELLRILDRIRPRTIAVNFSKDSVTADGLTHGLYLVLMDHLKGTKYEHRIVSSEGIVSALRGRKTHAEISRIRKAIAVTLDIFDRVTGFLGPGKTEKDVADFIMKHVRAMGLEPAWESEHCPAVFTGPEHAGAHFGPTNRKIEGGHVLNIDFGVKVDGYCSDLQRTWYIRRKGERRPPLEVTRGMMVIRDAIKAAVEALRPGSISWKVDDVARSHITSNGYPEYPHALGHQIGKAAHDGGIGLMPRWDRYGRLPFGRVEAGQVFTVEPRLPIEGYGVATIEEIVWVTEQRTVFLSKPQTRVWVV